ncbi:hypothetical protein [Vagococcus xieshaowenii]|uniref:DUF2187 domain-containing protein n=1 Tax=Vagococcus xieshaowenii TaxID=2562451 RepID=A0AAJ5EF28_9ENTE|nr:hypothetical protein [Vagococcus xieshaowenii]QCA29469.1 hypothetical protein E4Z98_09115 [Vagococcus xieshaowenii]TFZ39605.1 hypothetical protein E4031_08630 [Vagococcus xieshaowenii]
MTTIKIGDRCKCTSPLLTDIFWGRVEKLYSLSALVSVDTYQEKDAEKVLELNKRLIVSIATIEQPEKEDTQRNN